MMVSRLYSYLNHLSIDVAIGAAVGAAFFARILDVGLLPQAYVVLFLTVWIIYTSDHLMDAYHLDKPASTARHLLHQQHFRILAWLVAVALVIDVTLALFIRRQLMIPGLIMAVMCASYLLLNRWLRYVKEVVGTLLYSGGVLLPALSLKPDAAFDQRLLLAQFVLIVFINMLLFARMSYESDLRDGQNSLFTTIGRRQGDWLIVLSFLSLLTIMILSASAIGAMTSAIMAAMALTLAAIFLLPSWFGSKERYRLVGDSVFLFPGVWLILN